jgi:hypothetical protein
MRLPPLSWECAYMATLSRDLSVLDFALAAFLLDSFIFRLAGADEDAVRLCFFVAPSAA